MLFTCKIHKKVFILCLISGHPALWQFVLFYARSTVSPKYEEISEISSE